MKMQILFAALLLSMGASAMPSLQIDVNGQLTGATSVDVDGVLYDVYFAEGTTCEEQFDGCDNISDFTFQDANSAVLASQALLDQVFLDSSLGLFDSEPALTSVCTFISECFILTPFDISLLGPAVGYFTAGALNYGPSDPNIAGEFGEQVFLDPNWAVWSASPPTAVPVPAAGWLLLSALAGLIGKKQLSRR